MTQPDLFSPGRPAIRPSTFCSDEERAVYQALEWGRGRAKQVRVMADETGITGRRVQEIVQHLLDEHAVPIGTSMSDPFGNYLIDSPGELEQTVALLRTRGLSNLTRAARLKGMSVRRYLDEVQTSLGVA